MKWYVKKCYANMWSMWNMWKHYGNPWRGSRALGVQIQDKNVGRIGNSFSLLDHNVSNPLLFVQGVNRTLLRKTKLNLGANSEPKISISKEGWKIIHSRRSGDRLRHRKSLWFLSRRMVMLHLGLVVVIGFYRIIPMVLRRSPMKTFFVGFQRPFQDSRQALTTSYGFYKSSGCIGHWQVDLLV